MTSDNERRAAAARLRALDVHEWYDSADEIDSLETAIGCSIGQDWQDQDWWERIADLIDRPTCHDVTDLDRESFKCSRCGYRVLSIDGAPDAAKLVSPKGGVVDFGYCPNCGAEVQE